MKNTIAAPALVAGLLAALLLTLIQTLWVSPLIWQAEVYENAAEAEPKPTPTPSADHAEADHATADDHHHHEAAADHDHGDAQAHEHQHDHGSEWQPEDGWQRVAFTSASNLVMSIGYALVLVALFHWRKPQTVAAGIGWGVAGYAVFFVAPSLGLPPELPGTAAAELTSRQAWWIATALCTALAIGLVFFRKDWLARAIAPVLLVAPHIYGAPQAPSHESLAPESLHHQFVIATSIANGVFWLTLGLCTVWLYRTWQRKSATP